MHFLSTLVCSYRRSKESEGKETKGGKSVSQKETSCGKLMQTSEKKEGVDQAV
jgi:hypothetical protein